MADGAGREKVTIRALLQSVKYGLSPEQLWKDYIKMIGEECQYCKYGHNSFIEFLQSMPDVARFCSVRGQPVVVPVATAETRHISKMVASQKCTVGSNVRTVRGKPSTDIKLVPLDLQAKVKRLLLSYPNGMALHHLPAAFAKRYGYNLIPEKFGYMSMEQFIGHGMHMDIRLDSAEHTQFVKLRDTPPASLSVAGFRPTVGRGRSHGGGAQGGWGQQSRRVGVHHHTVRDATTQEEQLTNKFNMNLSLNDIDRSPIGPPKPLPQQPAEKGGHTASTPPKPVPETFKGVLWRLLKQYPGGIPLPHFQEYYRRYAHEDLPVLGLGFSSVEQFVTAVPDVLVQKRTKNGCVMLVAAPTSPTADEPLKPLVPEDGPKDEEESPLPQPSFQKAPWPTEESVNVLVTHVVDPGHFFVQVLGKDSLEPLRTLQEDMTMFYGNSASPQRHYLADVKKGQVCVAVFPDDGLWYRAEIISVPDENRVSVRYVDYGNTATVSRTTVRKAKAHYFSLPVQALECTCAKIKPEGSQFWSAAATEYFRTMTEQKPVVAFVKKGHGQGGRLPLSLCDTSTEDDIFLSEELVRQGLAELDRPPVAKAHPCAPPPTPNQPTLPPVSQAVVEVSSASLTSPPLPSSQVPYYMVHPQLWSSYLNHVSTLQLQQGAGLGAGPYFSLSGQIQQPCGLEAYTVLTPTSDCTGGRMGLGAGMGLETGSGLGTGMGMSVNAAANQRSNLWLPSDDTELDTTPTTGYCPKVKAAEEAVAKLINERRRIIQSMTQLSDQSGSLSTAIDQLSAMEAQIRAAENKLQQLKAQQTSQCTGDTANTKLAHPDLVAPSSWTATSMGIGRGQPLSPQSVNPVMAAPGGLKEVWSGPSPGWQPQPTATRFPHPPPPDHQPTVGEYEQARSVRFGTESSLASHPHQADSWGKMGVQCPVSESQKSANIGIGRGSSMRVLCAQAGLDWI